MANEPRATYHEFNSGGAAREYRRRNGTGGLIFAAKDDTIAYLFPVGMTFGAIVRHPLTRGLSGEII